MFFLFNFRQFLYVKHNKYKLKTKFNFYFIINYVIKKKTKEIDDYKEMTIKIVYVRMYIRICMLHILKIKNRTLDNFVQCYHDVMLTHACIYNYVTLIAVIFTSIFLYIFV